MKSITIPRYIFKATSDIVCQVNLHGFCDSSNEAYCAVVYVQAEVPDGYISRIISGKTKVAPAKGLTIPRLELLSCLLLAELMYNLYEILKDVICINKKFLWSDSEIALAWIKNSDKEWKPWVENRVNKIRDFSHVDDW